MLERERPHYLSQMEAHFQINSTPQVCPTQWATLTPERNTNWHCKGYNKLGLASRPHHNIATNHGYFKLGFNEAPLWVWPPEQSHIQELIFVKAQVWWWHWESPPSSTRLAFGLRIRIQADRNAHKNLACPPNWDKWNQSLLMDQSGLYNLSKNWNEQRTWKKQ